MHALTDADLRASLVNVSQRERRSLVAPDLDAVRWDAIDFLGWRDVKRPQFGYVVVESDDGPVGILLRQGDVRPRTRAQCSWCTDVTLPNDVVFFSAKRGGEAGRRGDTVGTLVCAHFECSVNVRHDPPLAYIGFDVAAARAARIAALGERVRGFVDDVRRG